MASYEQLPTSEDSPKSPGRRRCLTASLKKLIAFAIIALGFLVLVERQRSSNESKSSDTSATVTGTFKALSTGAPSQQPTFSLPSGDRIPAIALGTWKASPGQVGSAVSIALKAGYRHIDGAWIYGNEVEVGNAIKTSGIDRKDIWLTSKLWNNFHAPEDVEPALDDALNKLQTSYLDLYLIHWPIAFERYRDVANVELTENPLPTWKKLEELIDKGRIRNIGVSNFNIRRLQNLTQSPNLKYLPAINQVELNWFNPQPELLSYAKAHGILLESYSPLGSSEQVRKALDVKEVKEVAEEFGIAPAQVIISWLYMRGTVVLPKSVNEGRIKENFELFELPRVAFDKIEHSARNHPPQRIIDFSKQWGVDIFEDEE